MTLHSVVIYGSVRSQRRGIKAVRFICDKLAERNHRVSLIDPLEYKLPLLDFMYKEYEKGKAPKPLDSLAQTIGSADGYVIVSGEYNHSIPPALTNLMDHFLEEYFFKPSAIVCYSNGHYAGVRAAMQLRAWLAELGTPSIPSLFPVAKVQDAFDETGAPQLPYLEKQASRFLDEYEWYVKSFKLGRKNYQLPY
jgi:NAD(P)H-dependent FMN reductase